jgi:hypothetical protein
MLCCYEDDSSVNNHPNLTCRYFVCSMKNIYDKNIMKHAISCVKFYQKKGNSMIDKKMMIYIKIKYEHVFIYIYYVHIVLLYNIV